MGATVTSFKTDRSASDPGTTKWSVELTVTDSPGKGVCETAARLGLALMVWGDRVPGAVEIAYLGALVGDTEKLKTVLGLVGCISESDAVDGVRERIAVSPAGQVLVKADLQRRSLTVANEGPESLLLEVWSSGHATATCVLAPGAKWIEHGSDDCVKGQFVGRTLSGCTHVSVEERW